MNMRVHATCVALRCGKTWRAALLRGASGTGKSDLALRLIDTGGRLVADDQTDLVRRDRQVIACAPARIAGLMEVRGLGIVKLGRDQVAKRAVVALLVDLIHPDEIERLPEAAEEEVLGIGLPVIALAPFEASAPAKLRLALSRIADA